MPAPPRPLFASDWLVGAPYDDIEIGVLKSGKESQVHLLARVGEARTSLLAEKRFKPRERRSFRDDWTYRAIWGESPRRESRAMRKGTRFGRRQIHARWIAHEWDALVRLHAAGVTVPPPVERTGNGYRMAFIGDDAQAAPRLADVRLDPATAARVWGELLGEVARMLEADVVHGDLSAFNVLWWRERAVLIDLSQSVDAVTHPAARDLLVRDIERAAAYFRRLGVAIDLPGSLAAVGDSPARFARQLLSS